MQFRERYDIVRQIGRGTTASVFLVYDKHLDQKWAAKVFDTALHIRENSAWMIRNEIQILKKIRDTAIPRVVDLYRENGFVYLIMDHMEGITVKNFVEQYGPVSEEVALAWMGELSGVLERLHRMHPPLYYCDLKPENIILKKDGRLSLVDFGSARFRPENEEPEFCLTGTKGYTAPELFFHQGRWESLLRADVDVYSLGATGFYLTTGMDPGNAPLLLDIKEREEGVLSKGFRRILSRCMGEKAGRYQSMERLNDTIHLKISGRS